MRIVDRKTFLSLPANTLFCKYHASRGFQELQIKGDSLSSNDYISQAIADAIENNSSEQYAELLHKAEFDGANISMDFDSGYRDGLFDGDDVKFAVYDQEDVSRLIARLRECAEPIEPTHRVALLKQPMLLDGDEFRSLWLANFIKLAKCRANGYMLVLSFPSKLAAQAYEFFYYWITKMVQIDPDTGTRPSAAVYTLSLTLSGVLDPTEGSAVVNIFPFSLDSPAQLSKNPIITFRVANIHHG